MPLPSEPENQKVNGELGRELQKPFKPRVSAQAFAFALLMATSLQIMENLLPRIPLFPWMRIGLSYVVILPFLWEYGPFGAFGLLLARNLITILYGGQPFSTFLIGTGAGAIAIFGVGSLAQWAVKKKILGILGSSILLAVAFNLSQLLLVKWILIRHTGFYFLMGPMLTWSLLSGTLVALLVHFSEKDLERMFAMPSIQNPPASLAPLRSTPSSFPLAANSKSLPFILGLFVLVGLVVGNYYWIQLPVLVVLFWLSRNPGKLLFAAWPFFFYLAWLHLFKTPGEYVFKDWITREGVHRFILNSLRLANFILLGRWLSRNFSWRPGGRSESPYLQGFLLSLPLLATMFESSLVFGKEMGKRIWAGQTHGILTPAFAAWQKKMDEAAIESSIQDNKSEAID